MTTMLTGGHCCVCSVVCAHINGPFYCEQHAPRTPTVDERMRGIPTEDLMEEIRRRREDRSFADRLRSRLKDDRELLRRLGSSS